MGPYRVFYLGVFQAMFYTRDEAVEFIVRETSRKIRSYGDYEILDRSDSL